MTTQNLTWQHCTDGHHPAARQYLEAGLAVDAADDLDDEVLEFGLVHEFGPVIGAVSEEMLDPGPAAADRMQDELGAGAVGDVGRGQVDHEQTPVGIDGDVPFAPDHLLSRVIAAFLGSWRLHRLAVDYARRRLPRSPRALAVDHQRHVMDGAEQQQPHEAAGPPKK